LLCSLRDPYPQFLWITLWMKWVKGIKVRINATYLLHWLKSNRSSIISYLSICYIVFIAFNCLYVVFLGENQRLKNKRILVVNNIRKKNLKRLVFHFKFE